MSDLKNIEVVGANGIVQRLEYNGFRFDPAATETLGISCLPIQDEAGRTIKYVQIDLEVRTVIYSDDITVTIDDAMQAIQNRLTSQGGALTYQLKGFGNLNVNTGQLPDTGNSPKWDVNWGPTPTKFQAKPIGNNLAWEVVWGVRICIPECDAAKYAKTLMAFNYQVQYINDDGGYGRRQVSGFIEVPITRQSQSVRIAPDSADNYRDQIVIECPTGFRQTSSSFLLSPNRVRESFQFDHEQLFAAAPPPGILRIKMSMKASNQYPMNFTYHTFTIDAEYELANGKGQNLANSHFRQVLKDRSDRLSKLLGLRNGLANFGGGPVAANPPQAQVGGGNATVESSGSFLGTALRGIRDAAGYLPSNLIGGAIKNAIGPGSKVASADDGLKNLFGDREGTGSSQKALVFPLYFTAEDPDAFGKPMARFSCTFMVAGTQVQFLTAGLWEPVVDSGDYKKWKTSLGKIWDNRGIVGLKFDAKADVIIDLCQTKSEGKTSTLKSQTNASTSTLKSAGNFVFQNQWGYWTNKLRSVQETSTAVMKTLPVVSSVLKSSASLSTTLVPLSYTNDPGNQFRVGGVPAIEQSSYVVSRTQPTYKVYMEGMAIKLGSSPNPPNLESIGGVPAVLTDESDVVYETIGNVDEIVYKTSWNLCYTLTSPIATPVFEESNLFTPSQPSSQGGTSSLQTPSPTSGGGYQTGNQQTGGGFNTGNNGGTSTLRTVDVGGNPPQDFDGGRWW